MAETIYPVQKLIYLTQEQAAAVKDFRFDHRLESDNEAIRRLLQLGLEAVANTAKKK